LKIFFQQFFIEAAISNSQYLTPALTPYAELRFAVIPIVILMIYSDIVIVSAQYNKRRVLTNKDIR
jgi:hypothetical protein